jgi:hypothetical protein
MAAHKSTVANSVATVILGHLAQLGFMALHGSSTNGSPKTYPLEYITGKKHKYFV